MRVLILGAGYVGAPLSHEIARLGHQVYALHRHPQPLRTAQSRDRKGASPTAAPHTPPDTPDIPHLTPDLTDLRSLETLPRHWDWIINTVSSGKGGPPQYEKVYLQGNRNLITWLREHPPRKYVYTSSTSVYGQTDGALVEETSPTEPQSATSRILVQTERLLLHEAQTENFPVVILRVAGIYGPGRGHLFQQFLKGEAAIPGKGDRMINMIHLQDVVGAIIAALENGVPGQIYNVADNEPISYLQFFGWLCQQFHRPMPPFVEEVSRKRGTTNKRVSNQKLRQELRYTLKFPNFRSGYEPEISALHD